MVGLIAISFEPNPAITLKGGMMQTSVSDQDLLYFRNLRQFYYEKEEKEEAKMDLFRLTSRNQDSLAPAINFTLVHNWSMNQAFIVGEKNAWFGTMDTVSIFWSNEATKEFGSLLLTDFDAEQHYLFALEFYNLVRHAEVRFFVEERPDKRLEFLQSEKERASLRKTIKDYFKLVGVVR